MASCIVVRAVHLANHPALRTAFQWFIRANHRRSKSSRMPPELLMKIFDLCASPPEDSVPKFGSRLAKEGLAPHAVPELTFSLLIEFSGDVETSRWARTGLSCRPDGWIGSFLFPLGSTIQTTDFTQRLISATETSEHDGGSFDGIAVEDDDAISLDDVWASAEAVLVVTRHGTAMAVAHWKGLREANTMVCEGADQRSLSFEDALVVAPYSWSVRLHQTSAVSGSWRTAGPPYK